jgi:hypothetical protein
MITRRIAMVLGAGASMPYGFPSGFDLMTQIINQLDPIRNNQPRSLMLAVGFEQIDIERFRDALRQSGRKSVDSFLEHRPEFIPIGKAATACMLLPCENTERLFSRNQSNWYEYLFNKLNAKFDNFEQNTIAIITFNYDRSLEQYLLTAMQNSYGRKADECAKKLAEIPIIHLHGQLGTLSDYDGKKIAFGAAIDAQAVRRAAAGIQIIHEDIKDKPQFQTAHQILSQAERICFLGFGYDQTNLERLSSGVELGNKVVIGSAKGITPMESDLIQQLLGKLGFRIPNVVDGQTLGFHPGKALDYMHGEVLEFLRHHCPLD